MAGEFLQLLASMERQKKAEVDADVKLALAINLQDRKEQSQSQERALTRKHQANIYLLNSSINQQKELKSDLSKAESDAEDLGISISEQSSLKSEDQSEAGKSILDLTFENKIEEIDFIKLADAGVGEKINAISEQNEQYEDRIETISQHMREYDAVEDTFKEFSKNLDVSGDWMVSEREMASFMALNKKDYQDTVERFGGDEAEVQRRLKSYFGQYREEELKVLNDILTIKASELNVREQQINLGLLPAPAAKTAEVMLETIDKNVKEFNSVMTMMGASYSPAQIEADPILAHFKGSTVPIAGNQAAADVHMDKIESRMSSVLRILNKNEGLFGDDKPSARFVNDKVALALWYSGEIVDMDLWMKNNPEYKSSKPDFKDKDGNKYMFTPDEDTKVKYALQRINKIELDKFSMRNPENVINGAIAFFKEYSKAHEMYSVIEDQNKLLKATTGMVSNPATGGYNLGARKDKFGREVFDSEVEQEEADEIEALKLFSKKNNMSIEAIQQNAKQSGFNRDISGYMEDYEKKSLKSTFNMSDSQLKNIYNESGIEGDGIPASERAVDIIKRLEIIDKSKSGTVKDWLSAVDFDGDDQLKKERLDLYNNRDYMGEEWEMLHEEGATLIDELIDIRDVAARLGQSGLWDYYLEGQITEDKIMGKRKIYTDEAMSIFNPRQLDPTQERGLVGGAIRQAPFIGRLFSPIEEEDIILKGQTGKGYKDRYKHRSQLEIALEQINKNEALSGGADPSWFETANENSLYENVELQLMDEIIVTPQ